MNNIDLSSYENPSPGYVFQRKKVKNLALEINEKIPWTPNQKNIIDLMSDKKTKIMFLKGYAGTGKTIMAIYCALKAIQEGKICDILYIRSVIESGSKELGFLPGEIQDKLKPFIRPLEDKLEELLSKESREAIRKNDLIQGAPVNYLRGAHFAGKFIYLDEAQNLTKEELTTVVTRIGENSKMVIAGDPMQSDLQKDKSAFMRFYNAFEAAAHPNVVCCELTKKDIVRSQLLREIIEIIEKI